MPPQTSSNCLYYSSSNNIAIGVVTKFQKSCLNIRLKFTRYFIECSTFIMALELLHENTWYLDYE